MNKVFIVSALRTPIGSFAGKLSKISAVILGSKAIKACINDINLDVNLIDEVFMGNVLSANLGQAPARQASLLAGLSNSTPCTTINKVCASGMKAVMIGAQSIMLGHNDVVVAGGMENMSSVPYYSDSLRFGKRLGDTKMIDGLVKDGLTDVYNNIHMGLCAEKCAEEMNFSRDQQDEFALNSYLKSTNAWNKGNFKNEVIPLEYEIKKNQYLKIEKDEEFSKLDVEKFKKLKTAFKNNGTITAGNSSKINDGASALILMSEKKINQLNLKPLAEIVSFSDHSQDPIWFTTSPTNASLKALSKINLNINEIDFFELNEAFSVVGLANIKKLKINPNIVNVNGGAVSLGHPLGNSGSRIIVTLINVLSQNNGKYGLASICNGGGGGSAIILKK